MVNEWSKIEEANRLSSIERIGIRVCNETEVWNWPRKVRQTKKKASWETISLENYQWKLGIKEENIIRKRQRERKRKQGNRRLQ